MSLFYLVVPLMTYFECHSEDSLSLYQSLQNFKKYFKCITFLFTYLKLYIFATVTDKNCETHK